MPNSDSTTPNADSRVFLGLQQPPLISAISWLLENYQSENAGGRTFDLSQVIIVLPTLRSQQRLLQLLVQAAESHEVFFTPPTITSLGQLPEFLYVAEKQLATDLAQQIAWSKAVEQSSLEEIKCLTGRAEVEDLQDWLPLATLVSKLHTRLANDIWSFSSVAREVQMVKGFLKEEASRWTALAAIQKRYYKILDEVDLWDRQAARNYAAAGLMKVNEIRCETDKQIVLIGTADLNRSISEMLRQILTGDENQVRVLVAAPESLAHRFNKLGSLMTEQWLDSKIELTDSQILFVDQPADQADAAAHYISHLASEFTTDEITIGVPDPTVIPQLQRSLNAIDVPHRDLAGRPLAETGPVRLMTACRDYLETESYDAFTALVRHPDVFRWLCGQVDGNAWLHDLDVYQNNNLPGRISLTAGQPFGSPGAIKEDFDPSDESAKKRAAKRSAAVGLLNRLHQQIGQLLTPLMGEPIGQVKPIAHWTRPWSQILIAIYGKRLLDKRDPSDLQTIKACDAIYSALGNQKQVPVAFGTEATASEALDWAIEAATEHRVVAPPVPDAVELAGWLDLTLDDVPVMVVTSMNDEHVPTSEIGHQFLPNELCKELKILDNDRRYARDAYALTVLASVRENLLLISGRRDGDGEPKKPSRLLFTDPQTSARRAKAFFSYAGKPESRLWICDEHPFPTDQQFEIPIPSQTHIPPNLSVTKFRDFIQCPYRFYLKHIMKLESADDDWRELSGGTFGDLTHNVLESFGKSDVVESTDVARVFEFLNEQLNEYVKARFSGSRLPAVRIQVEQLRLRLERFAVMQAEHRKAGWRIVSTEEHLFHEFDVDGSPFFINGKIDRVDQHEITGQVAVWDYKSSDKGDSPDQVHYSKRKREWKDLQLPLYRHLVKEVNAVAGADFSNVATGYILLPKKLDDVGFCRAEFTVEQLEHADETARQIIRKIRDGDFLPKSRNPPKYSEEFSAICQDNVFEQYVMPSGGPESEVAPW